MSEHATATVAGEEIEVRSVRGQEAVSELFTFSIQGGVAPDADVHAWHGAAASLVLSDGHGGRRTIRGVVAEGEALVYDDGTAIAEVTLVPQAHLLTLGRDCRYFLDKSVVELVTEVLGGTPHRWETTGSYAKRAYTVQYRESDWSFICRLLEQEGIYYWFDHEAGSQIVFADQSSAADDLVGGATMAYGEDTGLAQGAEAIHALGGAGVMVPTKFSQRSFDPANPALEVGASTGSGTLEVYDAPGGGSPDPAEMNRQADLAAKRAAAGGSSVAGQCTSSRLVPGRVVAVEGHPALDGRYFVTRSSVQVVQRRRDESTGDARSFQCSFSAIAADTPFVPPRRTPPAEQAGAQSGMVMGEGEIHPDEQGRVRVRMHWARKGGDGWWMRVAQRGTHDSLQIPRVGWNVLSFNDEGSVDAPSVLARIVDAEHPPPYPLPANKTRVVFKTPTSPGGGTHNEIYFEDKKGEEQMYIHASKDLDIYVKHLKADAVHRDQSRKVGRDRRLTVHKSRRERVEGNQAERIGRDDRIEVGQSNREAVEGDLTITVGGSRRVEAGKAHAIQVAGHRSMQVSSALIDVSLGDIAGSADAISTTVGGALIDVAAQSVSQETGGVGLSVVGGLRLRYAGDDHAQDVSSLYVEAVGGLLMQKTKGKYSDGATETASWKVGGLLQLKGKDLSVKAVEQIEIVCGNSSLLILPEEIVASSDELDLSESSDLVITTQVIEHN